MQNNFPAAPNRLSTLLLQAVVALTGIGVLAFLLWEPQVEGRNVHATFFEIYFEDTFLACAYVASIPVFVALYQAFTVLDRVRRNQAFSPQSVKALRIIKYCAMAVAGFALVGEAYLFLVQRNKDDIAGGVAMGLFIIVVSAVIAATAGMFERIFQSGVDMKSASDLNRVSAPR